MNASQGPVCRICMSAAHQYQSIFTPVKLKNCRNKKIVLSKMICSLANIKISSGDGLPENICLSCSDMTIKSYIFKLRCETSDKCFRIHLFNSRVQEKFPHLFIKKEKPDYADVSNNSDDINTNINDTETSNCATENCDNINNDEGETSIGREEFQCDICLEMFSDQDLLLRHKLTHTTKIETVIETETDNNSSKTDETTPATEGDSDSTTTSKLFSCTYCESSFSNSNEYETHMLTHNMDTSESSATIKINEDDPHMFKSSVFTYINEKNEQFVLCNLCNSLYVDDTILETHLKEHLITDLEKQSLICKKCNQIYEDFDNFKTHVKTVHHSNIPWPYINIKRSKKIDLVEETKPVEDLTTVRGKYWCTHCDKKFRTMRHYKKHCANDAQCCQEQDFSTRKVYECEVCFKGFNQMSNLKDHLRTHNGEKPFLCPQCGRGFNQLGNLRQHLKRHSGVKSYLCSTCGNGFVSKGELHTHLRKHTGDKPYICDICGNGFTTSSSLTKHKRIHSGEKPYACDKCSMKFNRAGILSRHKRTHTGEKPYKCKFCKKAYSQSNDLNCHLRIHTGEKPYPCKTCGKCFRLKTLLRTHVKTHIVCDEEIEEKIEIVEVQIKDEH